MPKLKQKERWRWALNCNLSLIPRRKLAQRMLLRSFRHYNQTLHCKNPWFSTIPPVTWKNVLSLIVNIFSHDILLVFLCSLFGFPQNFNSIKFKTMTKVFSARAWTLSKGFLRFILIVPLLILNHQDSIINLFIVKFTGFGFISFSYFEISLLLLHFVVLIINKMTIWC